MRPRYFLTLGLLLTTSCGYHVAGKADLMPKRITTIAIPEFGNITRRYKLSEDLTNAVTREFISRTRFHVVADPNQAQAILTGAVINYFSYPITTSSVQVIVILQVRLTDRSDNKVLFERPNFEVRERYEISTDPRAYFDESGVAMQRLSRDVARSVVSAVLENF
jgi:Lipopolysaccharide-assembly